MPTPRLTRLSLVLVLLLASTWMLACGDSTPTPDRETVTAPVDASTIAEELDRLAAAAEVPGLAFALVEPDGTIHEQVVGVATRATDEPVTVDTVFEAASLSKPVVAYGALRLVDDGRLDLDRPLGEIVDLEDFAPGAVDERLGRVTARHVLSHSSGMPNWRRGDELGLDFEPGERFRYSGEGFVLLGRALEAISGRRLDVYLREAVLDPLSMTRSSFVWRPEHGTWTTVGHDLTGAPTEKVRPESANAAASLHTTAGEYALFLREILEPTLVSAATVEAMATPAIAVDDESGALSWGLGWGLQSSSDDESPLLWHWGDNGVFRCFTAVSRADRRAVVYFTNSENGLAIADDVLALAFGAARHPAVAWADYERFDAPSFRLRRELLRAGLDGGADELRSVDAARRQELPRELFDEASYNRLGYDLLSRDAVSAAIAAFEINVEHFPDSSNVHDSLGEGLMVEAESLEGQERRRTIDRSIASYRRSLELDPDNGNAERMLERLRGLDA